MESFLTVFGEETSEYIEKRSRFIATLRHCETEQEANDFINEIRSKYWDAKHNVFAYSVEKGKLCRFSDDGEPHGTAGKPMLDVILGSNVKNIAVVVTRYFGGVLLGTGGLVHAYSKSTKDALNLAVKVKRVKVTQLETVCEYTDHAKLTSLISTVSGIIEDTEYTDKVKITYIIEENSVSDFLNKLEKKFSARVKAKEICEKYVEI